MKHFIVFIRSGDKWLGYMNIAAHDATDAANRTVADRDLNSSDVLYVCESEHSARFMVTGATEWAVKRTR